MKAATSSCSRMRIVLAELAQRVERRAREARVERARRDRLVAEQLLLERTVRDAQVRLEQIRRGETRVVVQPFRDRLPLRVGEPVALLQRERVLVRREALDLGEERAGSTP
jgi:hypothetical protein